VTITAIPTFHAGCRFRSRAEARYATFLDALTDPWRYEPQGWVLDNDECYLPDFWLPRLGGYLEVKGMWDESVRKVQRFAVAEIEEHPVYLAVGGIPSHRQLLTAGWWDPGEELGVTSLTPGFDWGMWFPPTDGAVLAACETARSERFEHSHEHSAATRRSRPPRRPVRSTARGEPWVHA